MKSNLFFKSSQFLFLAILLVKLEIASAQTEQIKCPVKTAEGSKVVDALDENLNKMARFTACGSDVETKGYDIESCNHYEACAKSILGTNDIKKFLQDSDFYHKEILPIFGGITASQVTNELLDKKLNEIEENKILRKYAEKIGINLPSKMQCEEQKSTGKCNRDDFEKSFVRSQKLCKESSGRTCFKLDDASYSNLELSSDKDIKADLFLDRMAEGKAVESIANDKTNIDDLISFYMTLKGKGKKQLSVQNKSQKINDYLKQLDQQKLLDPFMKLIKDDDDFINGLVESLNKVGATNKDALTQKFQEMRQKRIVAEFSGDNCKNKTTIRSICELKNSIETNAKKDIPPMDPKFMAQLTKNEDFESEYARIKLDKHSVISTKHEYMALIKGFQCYMMVYDFNKIQTQCLKDEPPSSPEKSAFSGGSSERRQFLPDENKEVIRAENSKEAIAAIESVNKIKPIPADNKDLTGVNAEIKNADTVDLNKTMADTFNTNLGNNNFDAKKPIANNTSYFAPSTNDADKEDKAKENDKSKDKIGSISIEDQINELNKKLSNTEDALSKLKDKKIADNEDQKAKDLKDSQMKTLEEQIKSLKTELANSKAKAAAVVEEKNDALRSAANNATIARTNRDEHSLNSQVQNNFNNEMRNQEAKDNARSIANANQATIANANAMANAASASAAISGATKYQGLVLTKMDGLSNEAIAETINTKIIESKGVPFFIEEGGFVKEIVPVLKDGKIVLDEKGKPMFEKIIKGKVADLKQKEAKRAPASINSQADLLKAEEAKVKREQDRLKYQQLKKISNEAVK